MNISRKNKKKILSKPLIIVGTFLLLGLLYSGLASALSWWPFLHNTRSDNKSIPSTQQNASEQPKTDVDTKKNYVDSNLHNNNNEQPTAPDVLILMDSYLYSAEIVVVSTKLGTVPDGTCTLTVTNGEKQNTQTADVIYQPTYSMCAGFSVPISKLGSGTWNMALKVDTRGRQLTTNRTMVVK